MTSSAPLPKLKTVYYDTLGRARMSFLFGSVGRPDSISVGIGKASPYTAEIIEQRCNGFPVLVEVAQQIISADAGDGISISHAVQLLKEALAKVGTGHP